MQKSTISKIKSGAKLAVSFATVAAISPLSAFAITGGSDPINLDTIDSNYQKITELKPSSYVRGAVNILLGVAGILSFFFLLWGGIQWILAGGDKEGTEKARKRITNALIGLAIVFSAYALLFIISSLFGVTLLNFELKPLSGS